MATNFNVSPEAAQATIKAALHDRILGCLFGSALGDAIGLYTEFLSTDMAVHSYTDRKFTLLPKDQATQFRHDSHRAPHLPGEWTDDTDHAMLILLAYLHVDGKELDPKEFASRLSIWVQQGLRALDTLPLGLGRTVGAIVRSKAYLEAPEDTARHHWKICNYNAAPNGSLMRTHPLGLMCLSKTLEETFEIAASYSVMTHVDPRCIICCAVGTALVRGLTLGEIRGEGGIDDVAKKALEWWEKYREGQMKDESRKDEPDLDRDEFWRHVRVDDYADLELGQGWKIGYVYKCFGAGVHALRLAFRTLASRPKTLHNEMSIFEPLITDLIMWGGDADTNACFAGALLGSFLGYKNLPTHWRDGLTHGEWLLQKSESLCAVVGVVDMWYSGPDDKDTAPDGGRGYITPHEMEGKAMLLQARMVEREREWKRKEEEKKKGGSSWFGWK